jgi:transposase
MLTGMTETDWKIAVEVFRAVRSKRGEPGHDDRKFLEALHYFTVHNITWRALPAEFGNWNSVWKRFWRLSQTGTLVETLVWFRQAKPSGIFRGACQPERKRSLGANV